MKALIAGRKTSIQFTGQFLNYYNNLITNTILKTPIKKIPKIGKILLCLGKTTESGK